MRFAAMQVAAVLAFSAVAAVAQDYPARTVRFVVPYAPGGPVDIVTRVTARKLTEALKQQVVVDNRAGAGGNIGLEVAARAAPDGYTLFMGANGVIAINPSLYRKMPVDPEKDLAAISMVASSAMILVVHPSLPVSGVKQLIALAKSMPGAVSYASSGSGSTAHLSSELFRSMAGIKLLHVPYKGAGPALTDLVSGQTQMMFTGISSTLPYVKAGRLRALGVSSDRRLPILPEVPAVTEQLPGYEVITWYGVFAPSGTPEAVIEKLSRTLAGIFATPDARNRLAALGAEARTNTPAEFSRMIAGERAKWAKIVRESGMRAD